MKKTVRTVKTVKTVGTIALLIIAIAAMTLFCACKAKTGKKADEKATENPTSEIISTEAPVTDAPPASEPPTAGTQEPTKEPKQIPAMLDPGTDVFFDLTEYGDNYLTIDANRAVNMEETEEGILLYPVANDPYIHINLDASDQVPAEEYTYIALKVKASRNDLGGELRFATTTDSRGHALVPFEYHTPGEWEIIIADTTTAGYMNDDTLEGDITRLRIDPFNDGARVLPEDYTLVIESIALFDDLEKAQEYKGLYQWPGENNE